jgi:hypothetical protein
MVMCEEMKRLRDMLTSHKIEYTDASTICPKELISKCMAHGLSENMSDTTVYRTHFKIGTDIYSVIYGYATYGGYDPVTDVDKKYLELRINGDKPVGFLTANDIISYIKIKHNLVSYYEGDY